MSHAPVPPGDSPVILSGSPVILSGSPVILSVSEGSLSHDIADYPAGIVIPIDKPYRWTSADVIRKVKFAAFRHFRKKNLKVGHAGTLDPLATGVLLVCIGAACKRAQEFQDHDKEYVAGIRFGATTPSYDLEKDVDRTFPYEHITEESVREALKDFLGPQEQIAPLFSAKSVDGVRAYELARKLYRKSQRGDLDPDFDAAALETLHRSRITISDLELLGFDPASAEPPRTNFFPPEKRSEKSCPTPDADALQVSPLSAVSSVISSDSLPVIPDGAHSVISSGSSVIPDEALPVVSSDSSVIPSEAKESADSFVDRRSPQNGNASSRINVTDTSGMGLPTATVRIACSKGTYIRAFARDLGEALGSGAHLSSLVRTRTGDFSLENALSLDDTLALLAD